MGSPLGLAELGEERKHLVLSQNGSTIPVDETRRRAEGTKGSHGRRAWGLRSRPSSAPPAPAPRARAADPQGPTQRSAQRKHIVTSPISKRCQRQTLSPRASSLCW